MMEQLLTLYKSIQTDMDSVDRDRQVLEDYLPMIQAHVTLEESMVKRAANLSSDEPTVQEVPSSGETKVVPEEASSLSVTDSNSAQLCSPPTTPSFSLPSSFSSPASIKPTFPLPSSNSSNNSDDTPPHHPLALRLWIRSETSWLKFRSLILFELDSVLPTRRDRLLTHQLSLLKQLTDFSEKIQSLELAKEEHIRVKEIEREERIRQCEIAKDEKVRIEELQKETQVRLREIEKEERVRLQELINENEKHKVKESALATRLTLVTPPGVTADQKQKRVEKEEQSKDEIVAAAAAASAAAARAGAGGSSGSKPAWLVAIEAKEAAAAGSGTTSAGSSAGTRGTNSVVTPQTTEPSETKSYLAKADTAPVFRAPSRDDDASSSETTTSSSSSSKRSREGVRAGYASRVDAIINNIR
ncbi:hypothetical protein BGZ83_004423 [Gryganskiella cystojenkinii]|nr:hypothetical protein BGZ83_004423 [Gryganskiella cystojenkinii]